MIDFVREQFRKREKMFANATKVVRIDENLPGFSTAKPEEWGGFCVK